MMKNIYIKKRFSGLNKFSEKKVGQKVGQLFSIDKEKVPKLL